MMETKTNAKIEAIYPLSILQQGILFHHLANEHDQGLLHVQCGLQGELDFQRLKDSWDIIANRHETLRTSVHWKNMDHPLQIVRPNRQMQWTELDWSELNAEQRDQKLEELKKQDRRDGIHFEKNPLNKIRLIKTTENSYLLVWLCHHLLLDGWSASIILEDVFKVYQALLNNQEHGLEAIPSYKSYLNWSKKNHVEADAQNFWKSKFGDFSNPCLFNSKNSRNGIFISKKLDLDKKTTSQLRQLAKNTKVSTSTLFQGVWGLVLARHFDSLDMVSGLTVSGRSKPFPKIELMGGMFANVVPFRMKISSDLLLSDWLKMLQTDLFAISEFEQSQSEQITNWIDWKSPQPLFDNLFVFENFPWKDIQSGSVTVKGFESGLTTTYPLTLTVVDRDLFEMELIYDNGVLSEDVIHWFTENIEVCVHQLLAQEGGKLNGILESLRPTIKSKVDDIDADTTHLEKVEIRNYVAPKNELQLKLVRIWESFFNRDPIGIRDNFFELGGKSLLALKMFTHIEQKLNIKINPTVLLEHPTIESISKHIAKDETPEEWKYTVPIRSSGKNPALFCIHGGGGHVFFFKEMADGIGSDSPIYALQPSGILDGGTLHKSIEEMARDYADEILKIQPNGPYNILVYCFSTAVGIEMSVYLEEKGHATNLIVIDSIVDQENFRNTSRIISRTLGFFKRVFKNPVSAIRLAFKNQWSRYARPIKTSVFGSKHDKNLAKVANNLIRIYNRYPWERKHSANLYLILTEKEDQRVDSEYRKGWEQISYNGINVMYTEGHHFTLFEGEDAISLARNLDIILAD